VERNLARNLTNLRRIFLLVARKINFLHRAQKFVNVFLLFWTRFAGFQAMFNIGHVLLVAGRPRKSGTYIRSYDVWLSPLFAFSVCSKINICL